MLPEGYGGGHSACRADLANVVSDTVRSRSDESGRDN
jgi:hypothetical protein